MTQSERLDRVASILVGLKDLADKAKGVAEQDALDRIRLTTDAWIPFFTAHQVKWVLDNGQDYELLDEFTVSTITSLGEDARSGVGDLGKIFETCSLLENLFMIAGNQFLVNVEELITENEFLSELQSTKISARQVFTGSYPTEARSICKSAIQQTDNARMIDSLRSTLSKAVDAKANLEQVSTEIAESDLAGHYSSFSEDEKKTAGNFRIATISLIVLGVVVAALMQPHGVTTTGDVVYRLALLTGIFGLAGYLGRQAGHHRALAVWSATMAVQLHTFTSFLQPIRSEEIRHELRAKFAARVFGDPPPQKDEIEVTPTAGIVDAIVSGVMRNNPTK